MGFLQFSAVVQHATGAAPADSAALEAMWDELARLDGAPRAQADAPYLEPASGYEPDSVRPGSARVSVGGDREQWGITELVIDGPSHGNPFVDVELAARFTDDRGHGIAVGGFYDGAGVYRIRFSAPRAGTWTYVTTSNARSLDGLRGTFAAGPARAWQPRPGRRGRPLPLRLPGRHAVRARRDHLLRLDASAAGPPGAHAGDAGRPPRSASCGCACSRSRTCSTPTSRTATRSPRGADGDWDFTRFDPEFFRHLERRIDQLTGLGIETDLILFHPYDRWGFSEMPAAADDRYLRYLVRRLGAHRAVWWSLANEYDLMPWKIGRGLGARGGRHPRERPRGPPDLDPQLLRPVSTTAGRGSPTAASSGPTCTARRRTPRNGATAYGKPVVIDECGYEGDIDQGWGNLSGQELVRRCWEGAVRGGYVGHGETYLNEREELWWSKGGELAGDAPRRIGFLLEITDAAPGGVLEPLPGDWDVRWGGAEDYRIAYFGFGRPRFRDITTPPGTRWHVDVIDTWNMTVDRQAGTYEGCFRVGLPGREFMAVRLIRAEG